MFADTLHLSSVAIPRLVKIDEENIHFSYGDGKHKAETYRPTDRTLLAFARLWKAHLDDIRVFAARYGTLCIWEEGKAENHRGSAAPEYEDDDEGLKDWHGLELSDGSVWGPVSDGGLSYISTSREESWEMEPLQIWKQLSRRVDAVLRMNASLKGRAWDRKPAVGDEAGWLALDSYVPEDVSDAHFCLMREVNAWLGLGEVALQLGITESSRLRTDWRLDVRYKGLLGGIAYQLLLNVIGESRLYACCGCGRPYIRLRRAPRPRQENFCDDCTDISKRRASLRWKERNR